MKKHGKTPVNTGKHGKTPVNTGKYGYRVVPQWHSSVQGGPTVAQQCTVGVTVGVTVYSGCHSVPGPIPRVPHQYRTLATTTPYPGHPTHPTHHRTRTSAQSMPRYGCPVFARLLLDTIYDPKHPYNPFMDHNCFMGPP